MITELVVLARRRLMRQKRIFVPLESVERIDWPNRTLYLRPSWQDVTRASDDTRRPC